MAEKEVCVNGIPSGDHECWCLLVDRETFIRLKGEAPDEEFDVGPFAPKGSPYRYMVYPHHLLAGEYDTKKLMTIYVKSVIPEERPPCEHELENFRFQHGDTTFQRCRKCGWLPFHDSSEKDSHEKA